MILSGSVVYLTIFAGFLLVMLGLGIWVSRRVSTGEDFIMGGRSLGTPLLLGTMLATLVGTGSSLGAVGFAFTNGWAGMLYGIGGAVGVFALLLLFADVRKYNFMTFSEELSFYYGANRPLKGAVAIVLFVAEIGWLGAHVLGGATYLSYLTGMESWLAKIVVALGFGLYTIIGGYMAVVITDAVQGTILFVGFTTLAVLSFRAVGGFEGFSQGLSGDMDSFLGVGTMGVIPAISLAVVIAVGVLATPSYRHRIYSARDTSTVRKSFFLVGILFAIFAFMPAIAGMSARILNPGLENTDFAFPFLATEMFPVWLGAFLLVAGLSATMSSGDSDAIASVAILLRDVYQIFTGRLPAQENMILYSRIALALTLMLAFLLTLAATTIIDYITLLISTVLSGLFVAAVLGKFWHRATWQGGVASMAGGSTTALFVNFSEPLTSFWGNPILPSLTVALVAGVAVSLVTPRTSTSREEALRILDEERAAIDVGTKLKAGASGE